MVGPSFRSNLDYWFLKAASHISFHYDAGGIVGILSYQDNHDVTLGNGISCLFLPSFVGICLVERIIPNPMLSEVSSLLVEAILEILVFVKLKTHKNVQNSDISLERKNLAGGYKPNRSDDLTINIISAVA